MHEHEKDGPISDEISIVRSNSLVTISDVFGLGAVAKSEAGKEVARAIGELLGTFLDPLKTYLQGRAEISTSARAVISRATAEVDAERVRQAGSELLSRAGQRFIITESIKQSNLETALQKSIEILDNESSTSKPRAVDPTWMLKWIDGAQQATTDNLREMWARILSAQASEDKHNVSASSLLLMSHMDQDLALSLEKFLLWLRTYGCFPWHEKIIFKNIDLEKIKLLMEIGFLEITIDENFPLGDFKIIFGGDHRNKFSMHHSRIVLTRRGYEIALALFGPNLDQGTLKDAHVSQPEQVDQLTHIIKTAVECGPRPIGLKMEGESTTRATFKIFGVRTESQSAEQPREICFDLLGANLSAPTKEVLSALDLHFDVEESAVHKPLGT